MKRPISTVLLRFMGIGALASLMTVGAVILPVDLARAQTRFGNCYWDGTAPICEGRCRGGFVATRFNGSGCLTGSRVLCCEPMGFISQPQTRECTPARYGTPGCPYPSFGVSQRTCPVGTRGVWPRCRRIGYPPSNEPCPRGMFKGGNGECYPILN